MSKKTDLRHRQQCVRVYQLKRDGMTVREIADLTGRKQAQVSQMIKVGERFSQ